MKAEVKKLDHATRELCVEVAGDVVKNKFEDVFKKITQEAKIKGFRPGHAPRDIIEKEYSHVAHEQVLRELIPEAYQQALDQEKIEAIDYPQISDVKLERTLLSFKAKVEITPEIVVKNYKGIALTYAKPAVSSDEIKRQLDSIKESRKIDTMDDAFARGLGYPSLDELKAVMERQALVAKDNAQRHAVEKQLIDHLTKGLDVKLPQSLVSKQLEEMLRQTKIDLALKGVPKEKIVEEEEALRKELEPQARRQVLVYLVLSSIARTEGIAIDDQMTHKVMELLYANAKWDVKEGHG
ncbi:MAG: trigger factor [Candidatus Omnitrophica bacterium]|nr:trigger factor [Candidatus Omnitrophota bacterium]MDD5774625.1 trigger factor [Candidatus Omnitrophota bacterium]